VRGVAGRGLRCRWSQAAGALPAAPGLARAARLRLHECVHAAGTPGRCVSAEAGRLSRVRAAGGAPAAVV